MIERIKKAILYQLGVYTEVANDATFTTSAWVILAVSYVLYALGGAATTSIFGLYHWSLLSFILTAVLGIGSFVLGVFVIVWLAKPLFNVDLQFETLFRPLALASVFYAAGILGLIPGIGGVLHILAALAAFVAMLFALKTVTGLDWIKVIALIVLMGLVVGMVSGIISAIVGLGAARIALTGLG